MATSIVRTYRHNGSGVYATNADGCDGMLIITTNCTITEAVLEGSEFEYYSANRVAFLPYPKTGDLYLTLSDTRNVYVLLFNQGNTFCSSVTSSATVNPGSWFETTLPTTVDNSITAITNYYNSTYVANETTGWTQDYEATGADGIVIYNMRRKDSSAGGETYTVKNNGSIARNYIRTMVNICYVPLPSEQIIWIV